LLVLLTATATVSSEEVVVKYVTATAYALPGHFKTSSGKPVRIGMIALSRDLERKYRLKFGDIVKVHGVGEFIFEDRMPPKWSNRMDIYLGNRAKALQFGIQKRDISFIKQGTGRMNGCSLGREVSSKNTKRHRITRKLQK
jgi:3D (Asp-Asp-Asp) domain-containing protein